MSPVLSCQPCQSPDRELTQAVQHDEQVRVGTVLGGGVLAVQPQRCERGRRVETGEARERLELDRIGHEDVGAKLRECSAPTFVVPTMASSSSVQLSSPLPRLALVALASIAATSSSIFAAQAFRRRRQRLELRNHAEQSSGAGSAAFASHESAGAQPQTPSAGRTGKGKRKTSEVIIREALARNYVYFGEEGMKSIRESFVIIVGLGGVGSAVATMLVRSGVGRVRLIDFDQVSLSSLNVILPAPFASPADAARAETLNGNTGQRWYAQGHCMSRLLCEHRALGRGGGTDGAVRQGLGCRAAFRHVRPSRPPASR